MDYLQYYRNYKLVSDKWSFCFKPYYKWITFNTVRKMIIFLVFSVLNLIINGLPSILKRVRPIRRRNKKMEVLNLIINGLPSIQYAVVNNCWSYIYGFKPYYKWITFNTWMINVFVWQKRFWCFKPYYKWITFNTLIVIYILGVLL